MNYCLISIYCYCLYSYFSFLVDGVVGSGGGESLQPVGRHYALNQVCGSESCLPEGWIRIQDFRNGGSGFPQRLFQLRFEQVFLLNGLRPVFEGSDPVYSEVLNPVLLIVCIRF